MDRRRLTLENSFPVATIDFDKDIKRILSAKPGAPFSRSGSDVEPACLDGAQSPTEGKAWRRA
jgi:hypothetical protein